MDFNARDEEAGLPGNARAQRPRSSVPSFLFISFMLFMLTSHNGDEFLARHQYQDAVLSLTYQLSNYTSWLNGNVSNFSVVSLLLMSFETSLMRIISQRKTQPSHRCWMSLGFREDYWTPLKIRIIPISLDLYTEMPSLRTSHYPRLQWTKHCHGCNRQNNSWPMLIQQTSQTDSDRGIGFPLRRLR